MYFECGRLKLKIGFLFTAFLAFLFLTQHAKDLCLFLLSAAAHEAGHLIMLFHFGMSEITVELHPGGTAIRDTSLPLLPYRQTFAAAIAGPAVNLLASAAFFYLKHVTGRTIITDLAAINLLLGAVNLLPLSFFDGGNALRSLLSAVRKDPAPPDMTAVDIITLIGMSAGCVFLIFTGREAYFAIALTGYCILFRFFR